MLVIQGNSLPARPDDYGNSTAAAYALPSASTFSAEGMVERNTDVDVFKLTAGAGALTVTLTPATRGPNMDLLAELRNSAGAMVASANPADLLGGTMSSNVSAGTYYLTVKGTGKGDLATGYSSYASVGSYKVSGTLTAGTVVQVPPTASAKATPSSGIAPLVTQFDSTLSSDPDGSIVSWYWSFGDGTTSTSANPAHTYANPGSYSAWLTVKDNSGLSATANVIVTVSAPPVTNVPPTASISANPVSGVAPLSTAFSGANSRDTDGSIVSYTWSFGDGTSGSGISVSHTYAAAGTYTARLTVVDNSGASASSTVAITVTAPPTPPTPNGKPVVVAVSTVTGAYAPVTAKLSAEGSYDPDGTISSYRWDFGDGTSASGKTLSHTYKSAGIYIATVTAKDNLGNTNSASVTVVATQDPVKVVHVASIQMTLTTYTDSYGISTRVTVVGPDGKPVQGVLVTGVWSGAIAKTTKVTTNSTGNANFTSGRFSGGPIYFAVDSLVKVSYAYDAGSNAVTVTSLAPTPK